MRKAAAASAAIFALILLSGLLYSQVSRFTGAFTEICTEVNMLVPPIAMLLVIASAITYGVGQLLGAEMRARSAMWATTMITGTTMGVLLMVLMPPVLSIIMGATVSCRAGGSTGPAMSSCGSCTYNEAVDDCCGSAGGFYLCGHVISGPACVSHNYPYCYTGGGGMAVSSRTCPP